METTSFETAEQLSDCREFSADLKTILLSRVEEGFGVSGVVRGSFFMGAGDRKRTALPPSATWRACWNRRAVLPLAMKEGGGINMI